MGIIRRYSIAEHAEITSDTVRSSFAAKEWNALIDSLLPYAGRRLALLNRPDLEPRDIAMNAIEAHLSRQRQHDRQMMSDLDSFRTLLVSTIHSQTNNLIRKAEF